jgi:arylsulfatase A-like enzyme
MPGAERPNVLLITIDTLRADRLGVYGHARPTSPRLDAFAAGAVVFENAEASAPWTLPTLASVLTSEVPSTHGCRDFGSVLDGSFTTLAERLLAAGYDTACVVSHLFATSRHGLQQGFVHTDDSYAYPEVDPAQSVTSQVISDKAIRFLDQKEASPDKSPWLLWLHYFDPHDAYVQHPGISEAFVTPGERTPGQVLDDAYEGEIRYTDEHVGRVLDALERTGLARDTVVVVVADHGEEFYERGALGHGHSLHRELVHVPLLVRAPGTAPGRVRDVVRQVDVLPTVLELVGLAVPESAGRSLVPLLRGGTLPEAPALAELSQGQNRFDALREGRYKVLRAPDAGTSELYDLELDLDERTNVSAEHPDALARMLAELDRLQGEARARASLFGAAPEITFTPGQREDLDKLGYGASSPEDPEAER